MILIRTPRLTLEPLGMKHLNSTHKYAADPELTRLMVFLPVEDIAETERYLRRCESEAAKPQPQFLEMAIMLGERHIGSVSVCLEENGTVWELGWILSREFHGKGYAAEAARGLMEYCRASGPIYRSLRQREYGFAPGNGEAGNVPARDIPRQKEPLL